MEMTDLFKKLAFSSNWFKNCATTAIVNLQPIIQLWWGGFFWGEEQEGNYILVTEKVPQINLQRRMKLIDLCKKSAIYCYQILSNDFHHKFTNYVWDRVGDGKREKIFL